MWVIENIFFLISKWWFHKHKFEFPPKILEPWDLLLCLMRRVSAKYIFVVRVWLTAVSSRISHFLFCWHVEIINGIHGPSVVDTYHFIYTRVSMFCCQFIYFYFNINAVRFNFLCFAGQSKRLGWHRESYDAYSYYFPLFKGYRLVRN